jgi:O-antigen biosynthesis protein
LHDDTLIQNSWIETLTAIDPDEPRGTSSESASRAGLMRRVAASVPPGWKPLARRGLAGVSAHLPSELRYRLFRLLRTMGSEMGGIERDYPLWAKQFDQIDDGARRGIMAGIARLTQPPRISVLMPVFNPTPEHLLTAIHSVQDQLYPWWELCIADDASTDPEVLSVLRAAADRDDRIKLVRRDRNGHISAASNSALALASGRFVALLDHDDILPPHALYEVAARIEAQPDADILYSDEDHIDDRGRRSHPYFKPGWNHELILGQNLISHLGVYRRDLVEKIGGFRVGLEGSQDYDLALRAVAETSADRILHIPKVLYHWRQGAGENTFSEAAQDRCVQNGRRAVRDFVHREQPGAKVEPARVVAGWTRVVYPLPSPLPLVSVIVSPATTTDHLSRCIRNLLHETDYSAMEILLPSGQTPPVEDPCIRAAETGAARGEILLFLDPALEPRNPAWLAEMVSHAVRPGIGAVGVKVLDREGAVLHAGLAVGGPGGVFTPYIGRQGSDAGYFGHLQLARDVTAVSGGCLMVRREALLAAGGWDESVQSRIARDLDLCLRLEQAGLRNIWTPYAILIRQDKPNDRNAAGPATLRASLRRIQQKWGGRLQGDRYWNPNLARDSAAMRLAFPPTDREAVSLRVA